MSRTDAHSRLETFQEIVIGLVIVTPPKPILFDFLVAKVPTAVWADVQGRMDVSNFKGLETVSTAEEWWSFAARACQDRDAILENQERFLERLQIPADVAGRYAELMSRTP